jgi:DNA-binding HxlR family transcriptional regulator
VSTISVLSLKGTVKIIEALRKKDKMTYSELADIVGFATTTTRSLKALERGRFVRREVLDKPYRPVSYSLTEKGKKLSDIAIELQKLD